MLVYRLTPQAFAGDLSGLGAKKFGGRWNHKGVPILYCASSVSLCALELSAHAESVWELKSLAITCIEVSPKASIKIIDIEQLPAQWQALPAPIVCKDMGNDWAINLKTPILKLPSAIVPMECIYLINPLFPKIESLISIKRIEAFTLDPRIKQK